MAANAKVLNGTVRGPDSNLLLWAKLFCNASVLYVGYRNAKESFKVFEERMEDLTKELRKLRIVEEEKRDIQYLSLSVTKKLPATVGAPSWFQILTDLNNSVVGGTMYKNNLVTKSMVDKMMAASIRMKINDAVFCPNPCALVFLCKIVPTARNYDIIKLMEILGEEVGTKG